MSRGWRVSDVADMQGEQVQFAHVAKHLYNPREQWQQVVRDLGDPRHGAWEAGCVRSELRAQYPDCDRVTDRCREHVLRDHDEVLAPAYREALRAAQDVGRLGPIVDDTRAWVFVGDSGVMVIVREVGRPGLPEVKTAYRRVPRRSEGREPEDFLKAAVRKLRDKTSWRGGGS